MGKFFNDKPKKDIKLYIIIGASIIAVALLVLLFITVLNTKYELKENGVTIGIGEKYPSPTEFFKKINDDLTIKADYSKCDNTKVGSCDVTLSGDIKNKVVKLYIKDFTPPELVLKTELTINAGDKYTAEDFVESCEDNLNGKCTISFYNKGRDENGNKINYGVYTENGTYNIRITAKDEYGNESDVMDTLLIIGEAGECKYGDLEYSKETYTMPMSIEVGENGCALDKNLYKDTNIQGPANALYQKEYAKIQTDMAEILKKEYPNGANIVSCPSYVSIFNTEQKGLVGYSIYISIYISKDKQLTCTDENLDEYKVLSYYLNKDGSRSYETNKYNLK